MTTTAAHHRNTSTPPAPSAFDDELLTTPQVAKIYGCTAQWLERMRVDRKGPKYVKIGRLVRYRRSAVEAWIDTNEETVTG